MSFFNLLNMVSRSSNSNNRRNLESPRNTRKLRLETLETRELLAGYGGAMIDAELASQIFVTTLDDVKDENDGHISLREALENVTSDNYTITFADELIGGTITLNSDNGGLVISKRVIIDAWNLHTTEQGTSVKDVQGITIDGAEIYYGSVNVIPIVQVTAAASAANPTILRGITFTNSANAATMSKTLGNVQSGAAIYAASGSKVHLTIQNCVFTGVKYGARGVINFSGSELKITNSLIADNIALLTTFSPHSGVYVGGSANASIYNCTIANNIVGNNNPGSRGVYGAGSGAVGVYNSIVSGHTGSAFYKTSGTFEVKNSVVEPGSGNVTIDDAFNTIYSPTSSPTQPLYVNTAGKNYRLAKNSIAIKRGNVQDVSNNNGYCLTVNNDQRGYDLDGNYRYKIVGADSYLDAGAYAARVPSIVVTIQTDGPEGNGEIDHTDDFYSDGAPNKISLREAYDYVGKYYCGGDFNDFANSFAAADETQDPSEVYSTIRFASGVKNCVLASEIVSEKTYTIEGTNLGGVNVTVHGTATPITNPATDLVTTDATRIFNVQSGTITANNLNLANTLARPSENYPETYGKGGAVYVASGATYFANTGEFYNNFAETSGGAIYVAEGGVFAGSGFYFHDNQSLRGGAIANYGITETIDLNTFENNTAGGEAFRLLDSFDPTKTIGFGGAIYNAGELWACTPAQDYGTKFISNKALSNAPTVGGQLLGGSGGAIYNTTRTVGAETIVGTATLSNGSFTNNVASKYGGAIANFGDLDVRSTKFIKNTSSAGGAIQTSGTALISFSTFIENSATISTNRLTTDAQYGQDFGGNGGAIFASGKNADLTLSNLLTFNSNTAENAGGAVDYINGTMTFDGADAKFEGNYANVVGGAIVAAKQIAFRDSEWGGKPKFDFTANSAGHFAPNIAATASVRDDGIRAMGLAFIGSQTPNRIWLETFTRYKELSSEHQLTFEALAETFTFVPSVINVRVDGAAPISLTSGQGLDLPVGSRIVEYYAGDIPCVVFRSHISVSDAGTSVVASQIYLGDREYLLNSFEPDFYPAGLSLRVYPSNSKPIVSWTIDWGDGTPPTTSNNFGLNCDAYHAYAEAGKYNVTLVTVDSEGVSTTYENVAYCIVELASTGPVPQAIFEDAELVSDLFIDF